MKAALLVVGILILVSAVDDLDGALQMMKTTRAQLETLITDDIGNGALFFPKGCKLVPADKRASVVRAIGGYAKSFTKTEAFLKWYEGYRKDRKPEEPTLMKSGADQKKEQIDQIKQMIAETEKASQGATGQQKEAYRQAIDSAKKMIEQLQAPNPEQDAMINQLASQTNQEARDKNAKETADWSRDYPGKDPRPLLRKRLQDFLNATQGIDYAAVVLKKGDKLVFQNAAYEQKDTDWKLAFRAGKEATEAARSVAQQWLNELGK